MKIYAVARTEACDGGWPDETMYRRYEDAQKEMLRQVEEENNDRSADGWDNPFKEKDKDTWTDGYVYISIEEFKLK